MIRNQILIGGVLLALTFIPLPAQTSTLQQDFLEAYIALHQAECSDQSGNAQNALKQYQDCYDRLLKIRAENPDWEKALMENRIEDCRTRLAALQGTPILAPTPQTPKALSAGAKAPTLQQQYLEIYLKLNDSELMERSGNFSSALELFRDCYAQLQTLRVAHPDWESVLIASRMQDCHAKIAELLLKVPSSSGSQIASDPLATASSFLSTPATNVANAIPFRLPSPPSGKKASSYLWKTNIITTVFWIGSGTHPASVWNPIWIQENNGPDGWKDMSGYASSQHASEMNPFYVALPFNDLTHPDKALRWVPGSWFKQPRNEKPVSASQGRWIEIKGVTGRTCFAQWEDVGPDRKDHAEYVFGSERPDSGDRAGLEVSPAVAKYLGIKTPGSSVTSWRFADDADVRPGMWLKYDEQAILFRALEKSDITRADSTK